LSKVLKISYKIRNQ